MTKTLILVRHAHRDTSLRELDNGLDDKGREQAKNLKRFFMDRFHEEDFKRGLWFVSSPKVRCLETLGPAAKEVGRQVDAHPDLDEQSSRAGDAMEKRVQRFLQEWAKSQVGLTLLCSHGDWLPVACLQLFGLPQDFKKGAWLELEWSSGQAYLKWYLPSFKLFYR